jgi:hypothetical protein
MFPPSGTSTQLDSDERPDTPLAQALHLVVDFDFVDLLDGVRLISLQWQLGLSEFGRRWRHVQALLEHVVVRLLQADCIFGTIHGL